MTTGKPMSLLNPIIAVAIQIERRGFTIEAVHHNGDVGVVMAYDPDKPEYVCWMFTSDGSTHSGEYGTREYAARRYQQRVACNMPAPK